MDQFNTALLALHIISGFTALLTGLFAILSKKGLYVHRFSGKLFFYAMLLVSLTAFFISILKDNTFLLAVGFFALYQNLSGFRAIKNKLRKPFVLDWFVVAIGFLNGLFMMSTGAIVLMVFGGISLMLVAADLNVYLRKVKNKEVPKSAWLRQHIGMMMGTYIATSTAFIVVNISYAPLPWLPWLAPTFVMVPVMIYLQRKFIPTKKSQA